MQVEHAVGGMDQGVVGGKFSLAGDVAIREYDIARADRYDHQDRLAVAEMCDCVLETIGDPLEAGEKSVLHVGA